MKHRIEPAAAAFILATQVFVTACTGSAVAGIAGAVLTLAVLGRTFWSIR